MTGLEEHIIGIIEDAISEGAREWDALAIPSMEPAVTAARLIAQVITEELKVVGAYEDLEDRIEQLEAALYRIKQWADAYPLSVFPEPDMEQAAIALKTFGITLDAVSASNMRHVVQGVGTIAREALKGSEEDE